MDRISWSEKAIAFRDLVDNPSIQKPALVQIGSKAIIVGEKINGEFIMASPCKVSGDRFDVMEQELVLSSKHSGVWRVISKATSKKEGHIHRLTTKDLERIHKQDVRNERATPRSYICIRDVEAFELIVRNNDPTVANGRRIERRIKQIDEDIEFEITDAGEVEYTPSDGERTTQDYTMVPKSKQGTFLQLFLPGIVEQEQVIRNRVVRALHCATKGETRKRHFLLEVNEQPCEIRPIASEGSTELRYLHSTQNLYDYMLTYGNDTVLYVKLLRGDPPIKAIEFDGYMVLKNTLNGDKIPICRVEDLEITLVGPDLPVKVRLPTKDEHQWRSLSEVRAAEVQCMQLSLALLARHESEMYVTIEADKTRASYLQSTYNQDQRTYKSRSSFDSAQKHPEESEKVLLTNTKSKSRTEDTTRSYSSSERPSKSSLNSSKDVYKQQPTQYQESSKIVKEGPSKSHSSHAASDRYYRAADARPTTTYEESSRNSQRRSQPAVPPNPNSSSSNYKTKTSMN